MATEREIRALTNAVDGLPGQIKTCEEMALALIEVGEPVYGFWRRSDHERAQDEMRESARAALALVRRMRRETLSADLIRTQSSLSEILSCCGRCRDHNEPRVASKQPFNCVLRERAQEHGPFVLRFQLTKEGQILEQR